MSEQEINLNIIEQENPKNSHVDDSVVEQNSVKGYEDRVSKALAWAEQFNSMSEGEIKKMFSSDQLMYALKEIPTYFEGGIIPEEILEAEARIYSIYKPSDALQKMHKESNFSVIGSYNPQELFGLREQWKYLDVEQKLSFLQGYIKKLAGEYGFNQEIIINVIDQPFEAESAMWVSTHESNKVGVLFICKSEIEKASFTTVISTISHEMAHAFQEYLRKQEHPDDALQNDRNWLRIYNQRLGEKTSYTDAYKKSDYRYRIVPSEQDAWSMQLFAPERIDLVANEYANQILKTIGFDSYADFKEQTTISKWLRRKIGESKNINDLQQELENLGKNFSELASRISKIISGKNIDSILVEVEVIEGKIKTANEKLGLFNVEKKKIETKEQMRDKELKEVRDRLGI